MKILQITAHMGAGAGKAISGMAISDCSNKHTIVVLDRPEKTNHIDRCKYSGVDVVICPTISEIRNLVEATDVVVVNWWHHPLVYEVLVAIQDIPARWVLWSHVNGLFYPKLSYGLTTCFEACMFTSEASLCNHGWDINQKSDIAAKSKLVYGMGDFNPESFPTKNDYSISDKVKIGYIGSLDYAKLHPDFSIWLKVAIEINPAIQFEIVGDENAELINDVKKLGLIDNVSFLGFRTDIHNLLQSWDIFIYLLNPFNFATTENALLEALASGMPVITSSGIVEKSIVTNDENGICATDAKDFAEKIHLLIEDKEKRKVLGCNARLEIINKYKSNNNCNTFTSVIENTSLREKRKHYISKEIGETVFDWFLSGCGNDAELISKIANELQAVDNIDEYLLQIDELERIYKGESKGSVRQYSRYYPSDDNLYRLSKVIRI